MFSLRRFIPIIALLLASVAMPAKAADNTAFDADLVYWPVDLNPNPDELPARRIVIITWYLDPWMIINTLLELLRELFE